MTKKMYVVAAVAVMAFLTLFGVSSEAVVTEFEHFSIDVPAGWIVEEDKESNTTYFFSPNFAAVLTVAMIENEEGKSLDEWAMTLRNEMRGTNLEKSGSVYTFEFESEGIPSRAAVAENEMIVFLTVIGGHDDIEKMISSFTMTAVTPAVPLV